ncbi:MAG: acetoin dehydrogenase [Myxococcaceae bacterium]|nr:acetoin dehydrogenase [Myxococcaceae bacterium]
MSKFRGKVVAVTGSGSGIGRALAKQLSEAGAALALSDINEESLRETQAQLRGTARVTTHVVDVRKQPAVANYAAEVEREHGGCDVIINNAGVAVRASLADISYEQFAFVLDVNLWGVVYGTKEFLPLLLKRPEGQIVNISSINAMVPFAKNGPYNASKYAVLGFSETLMQEYEGSSIHITCVHPGGIRTNIATGPGFSEKEAAFFEKIAMTSAEQAAAAILAGVAKKQQRVYVGADSKVMAAAKRVLPSWTVKLVGQASSDISRSKNLAKWSALLPR